MIGGSEARQGGREGKVSREKAASDWPAARRSHETGIDAVTSCAQTRLQGRGGSGGGRASPKEKMLRGLR